MNKHPFEPSALFEDFGSVVLTEEEQREMNAIEEEARIRAVHDKWLELREEFEHMVKFTDAIRAARAAGARAKDVRDYLPKPKAGTEDE